MLLAAELAKTKNTRANPQPGERHDAHQDLARRPESMLPLCAKRNRALPDGRWRRVASTRQTLLDVLRRQRVRGAEQQRSAPTIGLTAALLHVGEREAREL